MNAISAIIVLALLAIVVWGLVVLLSSAIVQLVLLILAVGVLMTIFEKRKGS